MGRQAKSGSAVSLWQSNASKVTNQGKDRERMGLVLLISFLSACYHYFCFIWQHYNMLQCSPPNTFQGHLTISASLRHGKVFKSRGIREHTSMDFCGIWIKFWVIPKLTSSSTLCSLSSPDRLYHPRPCALLQIQKKKRAFKSQSFLNGDNSTHISEMRKTSDYTSIHLYILHSNEYKERNVIVYTFGLLKSTEFRTKISSKKK